MTKIQTQNFFSLDSYKIVIALYSCTCLDRAYVTCEQPIYTCREFSLFLFPSLIFKFLYLGLSILLSSLDTCHAIVQLLGLYEAVTIPVTAPPYGLYSPSARVPAYGHM
jgi:hypothetical protein